MKTLPLSQGQVAIVDDCDFPFLSRYKWYARKHRNTFYVMRNVRVGSKYTTVQMHRVLLNVHQHEQIDHRDGNGLNNRRKNLRIATPEGNRSNSRRYRNNTSGFKGVSFFKKRGKWVAYINSNGVRFHLGYFNTPETAHAAYCAAAVEHHGEFARVA